MKYNCILLFFIFIFITHVTCSPHGNKTYAEVYNLNFNISDNSTVDYAWMINPRYVDLQTFLISSEKDSLYTLRYNKQNSSTDRLRSELAQRILLPEHRGINGRISFEGKGKNLDITYITIDGINKHESILFSDTIKISLDSTLTTVSKDISLKDVDLLNLKIYTEGKKFEEAEISFSKLSIFIEEKHIDQYSLRELSTPSKQTKYGIVPLSLNGYKGFDKIGALRKKIIGLGESTHRNICITNSVNQTVMHQVEQGYCKLVAIESPMEKALLYNNYIKNKDFKLPEEYLDNEYLRTLLDKLKEYNKLKDDKDKVQLFGIDYVTSITSPETSITSVFDYLAICNAKKGVNELDKLALLLTDAATLAEAISFLENNKLALEKSLSIEDYKCILHILNLSNNLGTNQNERNYKRDSVMFINTQFIIDHFCPIDKQTIIYAHAVHLNSISTYPATPSTSLGHYLKEQYGENYAPLLFSIGTGSAKALGSLGLLEEKRLTLLPTGSIEHFLSLYNESLLYFPLTSDFNKIMLGRFNGNRHIPQEFYPYNFYQRYAGILFIKECDNTFNNESEYSLGDRMSKLMSSKDIDIEEMRKLREEINNAFEKESNKSMYKIKKREVFLEEIKKRLKMKID